MLNRDVLGVCGWNKYSPLQVRSGMEGYQQSAVSPQKHRKCKISEHKGNMLHCSIKYSANRFELVL